MEINFVTAFTIVVLIFICSRLFRKKDSVEYISDDDNKTKEQLLQELSEKLTNIIDSIFEKGLPDDVNGFALIIHPDWGSKWDFDILGTYHKKFLPRDEDWASDDFIPLAEMYKWKQKISEEEILQSAKQILEDYLANGRYAEELKSLEAVGLGLDSGDAIFLHLNDNNQ